MPESRRIGTPWAEGVLSEVQPEPAREAASGITELLDAILSVASELDLPAVLDRFVQVSARLTGARYGAINVLDSHGTSTTFVYTGVPTAVARMLASAPHAQGVLGMIPHEGVLRLDDLTQHPAFRGFPANHPPMGSFLGASVRLGKHVYGQLYLSEKEGGFTDADEQIVVALAAAAGVAVSNAQLYAEAAQREHWLRAGQDVTTMLLEGVDEEEALEHVAATAREVAHADTAALALPGLGGTLLIEMAVGHLAADLVGTMMPAGGRAEKVMLENKGMLAFNPSESIRTVVPELAAFGSALFAPLQTSGRGVGVLLLLRLNGKPLFEERDLATAESFAAQAALAYVLAEARHAQDIASLLDERERIARDLHDLAIQQLFATGMQLETVRRRAARGVDPSELLSIVDEALDNVDGSVRQIREIVFKLRDPDAATGLVERLRREASLARTGLGFAPSVVLTLDGALLDGGGSAEDDGLDDGLDEDRMDDRVGHALTDDVVAVVREGLANAARHAHASSVTVHVAVDGVGADGAVVVDVIDDGVGMPATRDRASGTGNLASRARQHNGSFSLGAPESGTGTHLRWTAPLG